jgi:hypothetical protein
LRTLFWLSVITGCLMAPIAQGQSFSFDGYKTSADSYTEKTDLYFYNGHEVEHYGTADAPIYKTYLHWGTGTDSSESSTTEYFFLYVETPIEVKNMIWGNEVTAADIAEYDVHYSNHHDDDPDMDYGRATGSEFLAFETVSGDQILKAGLDVNQGGKSKGGKSKGDNSPEDLIDVKTSLDYLLAHGATEDDSNDGSINSRNTGMAFELKFDLDTTANQELLDSIDIIQYHLSPERGLVPTQVPEPSGTLLLGITATVGILRRKR